MSKPKAKEPVVAESVTAKIVSKVPGYSGESAGVQFRDGIGSTNDPWRMQWFEDHGYTVERPTAVAPTKEKPPINKTPEDESEKGDE